uniref:Globin family profile domain-containing protein n=1 Tax=Plectus sambesii TaxID=2011161 RepID=A0A914XCJ0_9BILA
MGNKVSGRPEDSFPFLPTAEQERKLGGQQPLKKDLLSGHYGHNGHNGHTGYHGYHDHHGTDRSTWLDGVVLSRSQSGTALSDFKRRPRNRPSVRTSVIYEPVVEEKADGDELLDDNHKVSTLHGHAATFAPIVFAMSGIGPTRKRSSHKRLSDFSDIAHLAIASHGMQLSARQKQLIKTAWTESNRKGTHAAGEWIFHRIFSNRPELKTLFKLENVSLNKMTNEPQFQKHARVFTDVLEMSVDSMDALDDSLGPLLVSYGSRHATFVVEHGFRAEYWDAFSVAMCEYAASWKIKNNRVETIQAWRLLVLFLVNKVKQGFELEMLGQAAQTRKEKIRPTTQHLSVDFDP